MDRTIFLVDMQAFYASVEKVNQPRLQNKPVIVAGDPKQRSGIVLAACPIAKTFGVKTAEPLWQAKAKCPELEVVQPHMSLYLKISYQITKILEQYSDLVEVYSVDEQFIDVTHTIHLFETKEQMAKQIQDRKSTRLNSSHVSISYAVFCLKKKNNIHLYIQEHM